MSDPSERVPGPAAAPSAQPSESTSAAGNPGGAQSWSFGFFAISTTFAIVVVALAAPMLVNEVIYQFAGGSSDPADATAAGNRQLAGLVSWGQLLAFQLTVVVLTVAMSRTARGREPGLGWRPLASPMSWLQPFVLTVAVSIVTSILAYTYFADIIARDLAPIRQLIESAPLWLAALALCIGAPLSEELLFRGYLLHRLRQTPLGFWGAALIANVGWTALHVGYSWLSLADVFLAGLLFTWALWRTKSIWVPITFHAIYNAAVLVVLLIPSEKSPLPSLGHPFSAVFW